jgi:hypothetical protein
MQPASMAKLARTKNLSLRRAHRDEAIFMNDDAFPPSNMFHSTPRPTPQPTPQLKFRRGHLADRNHADGKKLPAPGIAAFSIDNPGRPKRRQYWSRKDRGIVELRPHRLVEIRPCHERGG